MADAELRAVLTALILEGRGDNTLVCACCGSDAWIWQAIKPNNLYTYFEAQCDRCGTYAKLGTPSELIMELE